MNSEFQILATHTPEHTPSLELKRQEGSIKVWIRQETQFNVKEELLNSMHPFT